MTPAQKKSCFDRLMMSEGNVDNLFLERDIFTYSHHVQKEEGQLHQQWQKDLEGRGEAPELWTSMSFPDKGK